MEVAGTGTGISRFLYSFAFAGSSEGSSMSRTSPAASLRKKDMPVFGEEEESEGSGR